MRVYGIISRKRSNQEDLRGWGRVSAIGVKD